MQSGAVPWRRVKWKRAAHLPLSLLRCTWMEQEHPTYLDICLIQNYILKKRYFSSNTSWRRNAICSLVFPSVRWQTSPNSEISAHQLPVAVCCQQEENLLQTSTAATGACMLPWSIWRGYLTWTSIPTCYHFSCITHALLPAAALEKPGAQMSHAE